MSDSVEIQDDMTTKQLIFHLLVAAVLGTIALLALADNPWDGDEFIKGPFAGITAYGGGDYKRIYEVLRRSRA